MKMIEVLSVPSQPGEQDIRLYPDFLIHRLIKLGICRIDADRSLSHDGRIDFTFTPHRMGKGELVASIGDRFFRPFLAHFGPKCGVADMVYGGHTLFACEQECEGRKRIHRFSLFTCNEPAMGIWMRLYFYCIDGVWPTREGTRS